MSEAQDLRLLALESTHPEEIARYKRALASYRAHMHPKMMSRQRFDADAAMAAKRELDAARAVIDALLPEVTP